MKILFNGELVELTAEQEEIVLAERQAEIEKQAEEDALREQNAWIEARRSEYPPIGDQLDALFHAGVFPEEMAAQIQAVKDAHPKPE